MFLLSRKRGQMPWGASGRLDSAIPPSVPLSGSQAKMREQTVPSALRAGTSPALSEFFEVCQDLANLHLLIYQQASEINCHNLAKIIVAGEEITVGQVHSFRASHHVFTKSVPCLGPKGSATLPEGCQRITCIPVRTAE